MDGYEATRAVRRREEGTLNHLPIMALTGHASDEEVQKCRQAGMDRVMTKPVRANLQELLRQANS